VTRWARSLAIGSACVAAPLAGQSPASRIAVTVSTDTSVAQTTHWPVRIRTSGTALVSVMLAPVAPDTPPLHLESRLIHDGETFWPLHGPGGEPLEPGIYRLLVTSQDSASGEEATRIRVVAVERAAADTQAHPPALDRAAFLPETTSVKTRRPGFLLIAGIGVASLATAWTFQEDEALSPITIAIPAAMAIGGLVGFLRGRTVTEEMPANAAHNRALVDADMAARQAIVSANARARAAATLRIRVLDQP
jgi:hypothetical protein